MKLISAVRKDGNYEFTFETDVLVPSEPTDNEPEGKPVEITFVFGADPPLKSKSSKEKFTDEEWQQNCMKEAILLAADTEQRIQKTQPAEPEDIAIFATLIGQPISPETFPLN